MFFFFVQGTVYEFEGCFFHGCDTCFPHRTTKNPVSKKTMEELYAETQAKLAHLRELGYTVQVLWEHEFDEIETTEFNDRDWESKRPMDIRNCLMGGRSGPLVLYKKVEAQEKIYYVDFSSLYPYCQTQRYFIGHPEVTTNFDGQDPQQVVRTTYGFVKCLVLPPQNLHFPVLPVRVRQKLCFVLCVPCAVVNQRQCNHSESERYMLGEWSSLELQLALEKGYKVMKVYETWHYSQSSDELFSSYIHLYFKAKQEASGWPAHVVTEEQKRQYIAEFLDKTGIQLEYEKIKKNDALRSFMKLQLNALWGKLGERMKKRITKFMNDPAEFFKVINDDGNKVKEVIVMNEEVVMVHYVRKDDFVVEHDSRSVPVAAWTTSLARVTLYRACDRLKPTQLLYTDTDSIIYSQKPGEPVLELGEGLGDLTSELKDPDDFITEFVSVAPKAYAFQTRLGKGQCKFKGIRANCTSEKLINLESLTKMVNDESVEQVVPTPQIVKERNSFVLKTASTREKKARLCFDKRVRHGYESVPFGYIQQ